MALLDCRKFAQYSKAQIVVSLFYAARERCSPHTYSSLSSRKPQQPPHIDHRPTFSYVYGIARGSCGSMVGRATKQAFLPRRLKRMYMYIYGRLSRCSDTSRGMSSAQFQTLVSRASLWRKTDRSRATTPPYAAGMILCAPTRAVVSLPKATDGF